MPLVSDDSDELHNKNAWNYLRCLDVSADPVSFESGDQLAEELCSCLCQVREFKNSAYKESFAYGDLYTNFLILLEQYIERYFARHNNYPDELLALVNSILRNFNVSIGKNTTN